MKMMALEGKRTLVVGFGRSGRAVADFLRRRGARVTVTDSRPPWTFASDLPELIAAKIGVEFGAHRDLSFLAQDLIVVSPGVPWDMPQLSAARERGIRVIPEVELAGWFLKGLLVGVTGSNGKTTTTTLIGRMVEASGFPTFVGGNIGVPLVSAVDDLSEDSVVVAELSSFQLEAIQELHPRVAILLNVTPNHLDRHASFEAYVEAKARIFHNQTPEDYAVLNADDPTVLNLVPRIKSRKIYFSRRRNLPDGLLVADGHILYRVNNLERAIAASSDLKLRGGFNVENALAATAAACALGADFGAMARAIREFSGVEHRLEYVRTVAGVEFYNDSKATSVDATAKALTAFDRGVHLILGGKNKGAPYAPLRDLMAGRVREALLIGAAAGRIEQELASSVPLVRAGDLETAMRQAFEVAESGDVILLAPACASYDQFENFEARGRRFKEIAAELAEENLSGSRRAATIGRPANAPPVVENTLRATEPSHPVEKPETNREPVIQYEVDADECAPLGLEAADEFQERDSTDQRAESIVSEDPLIFEVRGSAVRETRSPQGRQPVDEPAKPGQAKLF